ncbi:sensor histidine kinase [Pseudonocardia sp. CA-107938]|uniref:sensor histidine kinase n=1 Tax=Pseudonocardia sp. CA-107938 TaxID=3240021 RepID=UPI003D8C6D98
MRVRLLVVLTVLALAGVAAFALPLLAATAQERTQRFVLSRTSDLDRLAALAVQATLTGDTGVLRDEVAAHHDVYDEGVLVTDGRGLPVVADGLNLEGAGVRDAVEAALRNQPTALPDVLTPGADEPLLLSRPVGTGTGIVGAVVIRALPGVAVADIATAWVRLGAGALALAALAVGLAFLLTGWITRPLARLDAGIRALAAGGAGAPVAARGGPPELRTLTTAFNRMAETITASAEQQRRLVADASHQMRNPLAALRLRLDVLQRHVAPEGQQTYAATATELERLEGLLGGILDLAAAESRSTDRTAGGERVGVADLAAVTAEQVAVWRPVAEAAGVELRLRTAPGPFPVDCPAGELAQMLDVVLDNAIRHTSPGVTVTVACRPGAVEIADDGPGLAPDELTMATERFWRAPHSTGVRGSGLGLAIAAQLAAGHGGAVRLTATAGGGLTVTIELPVIGEQA